MTKIEPQESSQIVGNYKIQKTIGEGSYGKVKLGTNLKTNELVAIKVINKLNIKSTKQATRIKREIRFLKLLNHPNIVKVYDVLETTEHIYIVMEYAVGGEVFEYIVTHKRLKEKEARKFFRQIVSAVDYCHLNSVIHRDLKPENLLLDANKDIKIIDFGFSNTYKDSGLLETFCGSPFYAAPEMILGQKYEGPEVDIWSLGVILFTLLCGYLPFDDSNPKELYKKILAGVFVFPEFIKADARDLISRMICVDSKNRICLDEIKIHPWLNVGYTRMIHNHFPVRERVNLSQARPDVLQKLQSFGYTEEEIYFAFQGDQHNPITNTYNLIIEMLSRSKKAKASAPKDLCTINENSEIDNSFKHRRKSSLTEEGAQTAAAVADRHKRRFSLQAVHENQQPISIPEEMRVVNGWFFNVSTTSSKQPYEIMDQIFYTLEIFGVEYFPNGFIINCKYEKIEFIVEICRVTRLNLFGVNFKRLSGSFWSYKKLCNKLVGQMNV